MSPFGVSARERASTNRREALEALEALKKKALRRPERPELIPKRRHVIAEAAKVDRADPAKRVVELVDDGRGHDALLRLVELDDVVRRRALARRRREPRGEARSLVEQRR